MLTLGVGLIAALCWGIHDICVRYVSQRGGILPALTTVLIVGSLIMAPVALGLGDWSQMSARAYGLSAASGLAFTLACVGLYKSFGIGPVRLVAPIVGSYPALSIAWAAASGQAVSWDQWLAVFCVIAGVGIVGILTDDEDVGGSKRAAMLWALAGAVGFFMAFALGQSASQAGSEFPVILVTRLVAVGPVLVLLFASGARQMPARSAWPLLALMGLLDCVALGIVIYAGGMPRPEFAAVAASTFGMITILLAWAFLRERVSPGQWAGVALAFAAIGYLALI